MSKPETNQSIATKMTELERQVAWFDGDEFQLEQAIDKFHDAESLARDIEHDLDELKNEIIVIKQRFDQS